MGAGHSIPTSASALITGSLGGALAVADHVGGATGTALAAPARHAFISGMDLGLLVAALIVAVAGAAVLAVLPNRAPLATPDPELAGGTRPTRSPAPAITAMPALPVDSVQLVGSTRQSGHSPTRSSR